MNKQTFNRHVSNAIEYMYEKEWMHFPKSLDASVEFRIKKYAHGNTLVYETRKNNQVESHTIFFSKDFWFDEYNKVKEEKAKNYAMRLSMKKLCEKMYNHFYYN